MRNPGRAGITFTSVPLATPEAPLCLMEMMTQTKVNFTCLSVVRRSTAFVFTAEHLRLTLPTSTFRLPFFYVLSGRAKIRSSRTSIAASHTNCLRNQQSSPDSWAAVLTHSVRSQGILRMYVTLAVFISTVPTTGHCRAHLIGTLHVASATEIRRTLSTMSNLYDA